jgi:DsbC/DsbD-like thiol-disulfide interchange protein
MSFSKKTIHTFIKMKTAILTGMALQIVFLLSVRGAEGIVVQIIPESETIQPGTVFSAGIRFLMGEGGHIYWKNPGDSGLPTEMSWKLPAGFQAVETQWPVPKRFEEAGDVTFGYEKEVIFITIFSVPPDLKPGTRVTLSARVKWLLCSEICIPGEKNLELELRVENKTPLLRTEWITQFQTVRRSIPEKSAKFVTNASVRGKFIQLQLSLRNGSPPDILNVTVFPEQEGIIDYDSDVKLIKHENGVMIDLPVSQYMQKPPSVFKGVLVMQTSRNTADLHAVYFDVPLRIERGDSK